MGENENNKWCGAVTDSQIDELVKEVAELLERLVNSEGINNISNDIIIPLSDVTDGSERKIVAVRGKLAFTRDRRVLQARVKEKDWEEIIRQFRIEPGKIEKISALVGEPSKVIR